MDKIKIDDIYLFTSFAVGFDYWIWEKKALSTEQSAMQRYSDGFQINWNHTREMPTCSVKTTYFGELNKKKKKPCSFHFKRHRK